MSPIFVAIDTQDVHHAAAIARDVGGIAAGVKLGLEFFCANGHEGVLRMVEALACLDPAILTVHASGGRAMMAAAKAAAPPRTKVVGVTVLTSLDQSDLAASGVHGSPADQVRRLADLAREAGLDGIVCSGAEVAAARAAWADGFFVVPGVRPAGADIGDQKRVVTPAQALADGASALVIGRPITAAPNRAQAMMDIAASLAQTPAQARV